MGRERKRGKIEALNRLLTGEELMDRQSIVRVGEPSRLADVRFVITLDSDTQLPRDTARRMVETLAHPLNCPQPNADSNPEAYTIIQPRVSPSLPSASATAFSRLFTNPVGMDDDQVRNGNARGGLMSVAGGGWGIVRRVMKAQ